MCVIGDLRKAGFKNKSILIGEVVNVGYIPYTQLILHEQMPTKPTGRVVRIHRKTVKRLKNMNAWSRGVILLMLYNNRPEL